MVPAVEEEMEGEEDCARWDYQKGLELGALGICTR